MEIHLTKWKKSVLFASLLMGASVAQSGALMVNEQVLGATGLNGNNAKIHGQSVAIDGDWAFVGNTDKCQVFVYKWDPFTYLWGDGDVTGGGANVGVPYTILLDATNACNANGTGGFGTSVSTDNGLVVIGAPLAKDGGNIRYGAFHFYTYDDDQATCDTATCRKGWVREGGIDWAEDWEQLNDNAKDTLAVLVEDKQSESGFGTMVSVRYDTATQVALLVAGAPGYDAVDPVEPPDDGVDRGKIYVYKWDHANKVVTYVGSHLGSYAGDGLGAAVTSNGLQVLASAPFQDSTFGANDDAGLAFLYDYTEGTVGGTPGIITNVHTFKGGDDNIPSPTSHMGMSVSFADNDYGDGKNTIALGGQDTYIMKQTTSGNEYTWQATKTGTDGGDVSQSRKVINLAKRSDSFNVFYDKTTIDNTKVNDPDVTFVKPEDDYGRDISLSLPRLMVNGNGNVDSNVNGGDGVAYAYYPACGYGDYLYTNQWKMIGVQCLVTTDGNPPAPDKTNWASIDEIYGVDLGDYGPDWIMFRQGNLSSGDKDYTGRSAYYHMMDGSEKMDVGVGYWIISIKDSKFQVNQLGKSGAPLTAYYIDKIHPPASVDGGSAPAGDAYTILSLNNMMTQAPYGRGTGGTSDYRTMFANPLTVPTIWADALIEENDTTSTFFRIGDKANFFEDDPAVNAYLWHNGTGGIPPGYEAVSAGTPGLPNTIDPGEGFSVKFSSDLGTRLRDGNVTVLHLSEIQ